MQTVRYRGELVTFQIPDHWTIGEVDPSGGAAFFDPADDGVTLRLNVLTGVAPMELKKDGAEAVLANIARAFTGGIDRLDHDQAMAKMAPRCEQERGQVLEHHTWAVARAVPPRTSRIAMFTATLVVGSRDYSKDLAMIANEVRRCVISDAPLAPKTPWWKRLFN